MDNSLKPLDNTILPVNEQLPANVVFQQGEKNVHIDHADSVQQTVNLLFTGFVEAADGTMYPANRTVNWEYYNLFVAGGELKRNEQFVLQPDRVLPSYWTTEEIRAEYAALSEDAIKKIKTYPWRTGKSSSDYSVMVYNQDYITANIAKYHNLDGVFTVNEVNAEVVREVERLQAIMENASAARDRAIAQKKEKEELLKKKRADFETQCWAQSQHEREVFEKTQDGKKQKRTFADGILAVTSAKNHDQEKLEQEVGIAYSADTKTYPLFCAVPDVECLDGIPGTDILGKQIVSSSGTDFRYQHPEYHQIPN